MSLDNINIVDAVGTEISTGCVVLNILDPWDWTDEALHIDRLRQKISRYVEFVKSGQLQEDYPDAFGRSLRIEVVGRFPLPLTGKQFLEAASPTITSGVALTWRHLP